ncbi:MAG: hypothetical protein EZS28_048253, partial [Streblomastix strix]
DILAGSQGSPFRTIAYAVQTAPTSRDQGTTLSLADGSYSEKSIFILGRTIGIQGSGIYYKINATRSIGALVTQTNNLREVFISVYNGVLSLSTVTLTVNNDRSGGDPSQHHFIHLYGNAGEVNISGCKFVQHNPLLSISSEVIYSEKGTQITFNDVSFDSLIEEKYPVINFLCDRNPVLIQNTRFNNIVIKRATVGAVRIDYWQTGSVSFDGCSWNWGSAGAYDPNTPYSYDTKGSAIGAAMLVQLHNLNPDTNTIEIKNSLFNSNHGENSGAITIKGPSPESVQAVTFNTVRFENNYCFFEHFPSNREQMLAAGIWGPNSEKPIPKQQVHGHDVFVDATGVQQYLVGRFTRCVSYSASPQIAWRN